jgi:hypothetical protein
MYQKMVNAMISVHHFYDLNIPKADDVISHLYNMQGYEELLLRNSICKPDSLFNILISFKYSARTYWRHKFLHNFQKTSFRNFALEILITKMYRFSEIDSFIFWMFYLIRY